MKYRVIAFCQNLSERVYFLIPIAITIPFGISIGNIAIIITFLVAVISLIGRHENCKEIFRFTYIFPISFFFIILISTIYSYNYTEGLNELNKNLLVLLIAFIILTSSKNKGVLKKTLLAFALSTIFSTLILIIFAFSRSLYFKDYRFLFFHQFTEIYDQHPVYFSLYIAFSFFILLEQLFNSKIIRINLLYIYLGLSILFIGLVMAASKAVLTVFFILTPVYLSKRLLNKKQTLSLTVITIFLIFLIFQTPYLNNRFKKDLQLDVDFRPTLSITNAKVFKASEKLALSDLDLRYVLTTLSLYHFYSDDKVLFGYGVGDVQDYLDYYYLWYGLAPNWFENYNIHNQYIHILISMGIIVLLYFLTYLGWSFYSSYVFSNGLYLYFLIFITAIFLIEVILVRNKGIVFFFFFNTLFLKHSYFENRNTRVKGYPQ